MNKICKLDFQLPRSIRTQVIVLTTYCGHTDPRTDTHTHAPTHGRSPIEMSPSNFLGQGTITSDTVCLESISVFSLDLKKTMKYFRY